MDSEELEEMDEKWFVIKVYEPDRFDNLRSWLEKLKKMKGKAEKVEIPIEYFKVKLNKKMLVQEYHNQHDLQTYLE